MSERPKAAGPVMSRLRRPAGRLRDLPIWSKLGLIMIVPTLATIVVGTSGLVDHIRTATNAARAQTLADLSQVSGALVDNLQNERAHAVISLSVPSVDKAGRDRALQSYTGVHPAVDNAKRPYSQQRTSLNDVPPNLRKLLDDIDQSLGELPSLRSMVVNGKLQLSQAAGSYASLLSDLIDIRDSAAQLAGDPTLSDEMRAAGAVARSKEYLSMQRIVVHQALSVKAINAQLRKEYIATQTGQQQALQTFKSVANPTAGDLYNQTVTGPDLREAVSFAGYLEGMSGESLVGAPFDAASWDAAMVSQSRLVRNVETRLDADIVNRATRLKDDVQTRVLVETGVLLGMLLLAILFAWLVARSMARSLRELRHGALAVAQYGLPQAVARLRDPALSAHLSSAQLATQIAEPLPVRSRDEFGQVTEAFNAVHLEAVRTAAEQAALRASVSTMFVNLARRSQILVDRLIGHLDRLERGEEDPDRLAELFQLDHLATRMRRNDENLLVLAGADSTRIQREPAALMDVLRAAQSEVEHYTRIEFGMIDRDIEVSAHAVNDLVHLVAELFDNATAFSPPDSHVMVEARRVGDRAVLYVEDRGIGISGEQLRDLNDRLATPPMVDVTVSRMMGLVVVARLANRHGVKVELRPAAERGTVAEVNLPTAVLVPRALTGRLQQGAATAFDAGPVPQPAPRPTFAAPLALESGPAAAPSVPREPAPAYPTGRPFDPNPPLNGGGLIGAGPSRTMPAWSDLTGAAGTNGTNGRDALPFRPVPNGHGGDPLPQRPPAGDPWTVDGEVAGPGSATTIPRQMPSHPESYLRGPGVPPVSAPPVVSSPPVSGIPASGIPASGAPMSRGSAFGGPVSGGPVSGAPVSGGPVSGASPVTLPPTISPPPGFRAGQPGVPPVNPVSAPPAWPPVTAERDATAGAPPVPESLAAALDLTAELPRVRSEAARSGAVPTSTPQGPTHQGPAHQGPTQQTPTLQSPGQQGPGQQGPGQQGPGQQGPGQQGPGQQGPGQQAPVRRPTVAPAPMHQPAAQRPTGPQPAMQQPATPPSPARPPAPQPVVSSERRTRYADETMELPIFRELESAWFRTGRSGAKESASRPAAAPETTTPGRTAPGPTAAGQPASGRPAADQAAPDQSAADQVAPDQAAREQGAPDPAADGSRTTVKSSDDAVAAAAGSTQGRPSGTAGNDAPTAPSASGPADGGTPRGPQLVPGRNGAAAGNGAGATVPGRPEGPGWQTAADDGWRAAVAAADVPVVHTTQAGLPKRTPMAQLVPGGVDKAGTSVQRRTPESVRGLLSAYHRGVQRGRTKDHSTSPEDSPGGQQSSQSGLGPTAGSGQKEQEG